MLTVFLGKYENQEKARKSNKSLPVSSVNTMNVVGMTDLIDTCICYWKTCKKSCIYGKCIACI